MDVLGEELQLIDALARGETVVIDLHKTGGHKNVEQWAKDHGCFVYIGRYRPGYGSSRWRNPHKTGDPIANINAYAAYLLQNPKLLQELPSLRGKCLGCWCAETVCHGDVLTYFLDQLGKQKGTRPRVKPAPQIKGDGTVFVRERNILLEERTVNVNMEIIKQEAGTVTVTRTPTKQVVLKAYLYPDGTLKFE